MKVGDKVRKVDGTPFSNGDMVLTIWEISNKGYANSEVVWFKETGTNLPPWYIELDVPVKMEDLF